MTISGNNILDTREQKSYILGMKAPKTLQDAIIYFSDPERAFVYAVNLRWPNRRVICPRCNGEEHSFVKTRRIWFCKGCKKQFTVKVGSIFEDSPIPLDKWLTAMWMLANCKNGVSSYEIARDLGITQKSAWFMLQRIRLALQGNKPTVKMGGSGEVEVDETFIGGKARNMHKSRRMRRLAATGVGGKAPVLGMLERDGKVITMVVPNIGKKAIQQEIRNHVAAGSALYTDALLSYYGLDTDYLHRVIDHAEKYVEGRVHTNGMENFWSLLKRGLNGTYVSVEPFHLFRYLDEQTFRFK